MKLALLIFIILAVSSGLFFYFYSNFNESEDVKSLIVSSLEVFDNGNGTVTMLGEISNPNKNLGAEKFSYMLNLYDQSDKKIFSQTKESFIYPEKTRTIIETNIIVPVDETLRGEITIGKITWDIAEKFSYVPEKKIAVKNTTLKGGIGKLIINGILTNDNPQKVINVYLKAILFNKDFIKQGASVILLEEINSLESKNFSIEVPLNKKALQEVDMSKTKIVIEVAR